MDGPIFTAVARTIELQLGRRVVDSSDRLLEDLEADSFDFLNIVVALEAEHGIEIGEEEAVAARTVGDLAVLVGRLKR